MIRIKNFVFATATLCLAVNIYAAPSVGSVAIYSNGKVEKLLQLTSTTMKWEDARKRTYSRSVYPFIPQLAYTRFPQDRGGYTQSVKKGSPEQLMPFGSKERVTFKMLRTSSDGLKSKERVWRCDYQGVNEFQFEEVLIETVNYECIRYTPHNWRVKERLKIVYSPGLDMVVESSRERKGKTRTVRLLKLMSSEDSSPEVIAHYVKQLSN